MSFLPDLYSWISELNTYLHQNDELVQKLKKILGILAQNSKEISKDNVLQIKFFDLFVNFAQPYRCEYVEGRGMRKLWSYDKTVAFNTTEFVHEVFDLFYDIETQKVLDQIVEIESLLSTIWGMNDD